MFCLRLFYRHYNAKAVAKPAKSDKADETDRQRVNKCVRERERERRIFAALLIRLVVSSWASTAGPACVFAVVIFNAKPHNSL